MVRALKEVGWAGFSVNDALTPLINMGQQLFEPPDVAGWDLGPGWFSSGGMLARMNFGSQLAGNQKFNLTTAAKGASGSPEALLSFVLDALRTPALDRSVTNELLNYLRATGPWTGSTTQVPASTASSTSSSTGSRKPPRRCKVKLLLSPSVRRTGVLMPATPN